MSLRSTRFADDVVALGFGWRCGGRGVRAQLVAAVARDRGARVSIVAGVGGIAGVGGLAAGAPRTLLPVVRLLFEALWQRDVGRQQIPRENPDVKGHLGLSALRVEQPLLLVFEKTLLLPQLKFLAHVGRRSTGGGQSRGSRARR